MIILCKILVSLLIFIIALWVRQKMMKYCDARSCAEYEVTKSSKGGYFILNVENGLINDSDDTKQTGLVRIKSLKQFNRPDVIFTINGLEESKMDVEFIEENHIKFNATVDGTDKIGVKSQQCQRIWGYYESAMWLVAGIIIGWTIFY